MLSNITVPPLQIQMLHSDNKLLRFAAFFTNRTFLFCILNNILFFLTPNPTAALIFLRSKNFSNTFITLYIMFLWSDPPDVTKTLFNKFCFFFCLNFENFLSKIKYLVP